MVAVSETACLAAWNAASARPMATWVWTCVVCCNAAALLRAASACSSTTVLVLVGIGLLRDGFFMVAEALVGIRDGAVDLALGRDVPAPVEDLCRDIPAPAPSESAAMADRPVGMGGDSPDSSMGMSSGPCTLADSSPMSMSILPSCDMAIHDSGSATPAIDQTMHSLDVMKDDPSSRTRSTTKNFVRVLRWRCRRLNLHSHTSNPRFASRALPRQPWRSLGCCLDKAAPLALSPAPTRRCLGSETNLLAPMSFGRVQVPWPAPGLLSGCGSV